MDALEDSSQILFQALQAMSVARNIDRQRETGRLVERSSAVLFAVDRLKLLTQLVESGDVPRVWREFYNATEEVDFKAYGKDPKDYACYGVSKKGRWDR